MIVKPEPVMVEQNSTEIPKIEIIKYCPECGVEFTKTMSHQLNKDGFVYCSFCGKKLELPTSISSEG